MIAIIDYGMGNLRSVQKALEHVGAQDVKITHTPADILNAKKIVLPGVGAMQPAMQKLNELGLVGAIRKVTTDGKPFLGICLGFQLLFEKSTEGGFVEGLKILKGAVERFESTALPVPHMGWNQINFTSNIKTLGASLSNGDNVYFCHSYYVKPTDSAIIATTTNYGIDYASAIVSNNIWGVQFHPEKSQQVGLTILKNFVNL